MPRMLLIVAETVTPFSKCRVLERIRFESSVKGIASSLGSSTSLSEAKQQLSTALQGLATSYQQTFAKLSCG